MVSKLKIYLLIFDKSRRKSNLVFKTLKDHLSFVISSPRILTHCLYLQCPHQMPLLCFAVFQFHTLHPVCSHFPPYLESSFGETARGRACLPSYMHKTQIFRKGFPAVRLRMQTPPCRYWLHKRMLLSCPSRPGIIPDQTSQDNN